MHRSIKFYSNQTTLGGVMMSYQLANAAAQFYFFFRTADVALFRRPKSISKWNFVKISQFMAEISNVLSGTLNHTIPYYFRFGKTHVCHIRILLLVSISTISCNQHRPAKFHPNRASCSTVMILYRFSRW